MNGCQKIDKIIYRPSTRPITYPKILPTNPKDETIPSNTFPKKLKTKKKNTIPIIVSIFIF